MTVYKKCLLEISKQSTFTSKHNSLMKVYYETEDYVLKDYIRRYAECLAEAGHYQKAKLPSHCQRAVQGSEQVKQMLIDYCQQVEMSRKPEWQILAERYGWTPPANQGGI